MNSVVSPGLADSVDVAAAAPIAGWRAHLDLEFERRGERSVLAARRHDGPLVVQKSLHPEGEGICHAIVVHPPAGIAGGDQLALRASLGENSHAVLATPGAAKWYRSAGAWARQDIDFALAANAVLEWLPQESIFYDGSRAQSRTHVRLDRGARYLGWEIFCFGRKGAGVAMTMGDFDLGMNIAIEGKAGFIERGEFAAGSGFFSSPAGLDGKSVCGSLIAVAEGVDASLLAKCRAVIPSQGEGGVTLLPGMLVARYLGHVSEAAKNYFIALRRLLRPILANCEAADLRIWST
ncbi:MAG: urease accessory protein UreD [Burkholderiales bacterium]